MFHVLFLILFLVIYKHVSFSRFIITMVGIHPNMTAKNVDWEVLPQHKQNHGWERADFLLSNLVIIWFLFGIFLLGV